jgi:hypothetical protein
MPKKDKYVSPANPELNSAMHALGSSSATSPQESREDRKRPRRVLRQRAIQEGRDE